MLYSFGRFAVDRQRHSSYYVQLFVLIFSAFRTFCFADAVRVTFPRTYDGVFQQFSNVFFPNCLFEVGQSEKMTTFLISINFFNAYVFFVPSRTLLIRHEINCLNNIYKNLVHKNSDEKSISKIQNIRCDH